MAIVVILYLLCVHVEIRSICKRVSVFAAKNWYFSIATIQLVERERGKAKEKWRHIEGNTNME